MTPKDPPGKISGKHLLVQIICCLLVIFVNYSWTHGFFEWDEGIRSVLKATENEPLEFYPKFLDLARFPDITHLNNLVNFLQEKYRSKKLDLLNSGRTFGPWPTGNCRAKVIKVLEHVERRIG